MGAWRYPEMKDEHLLSSIPRITISEPQAGVEHAPYGSSSCWRITNSLLLESTFRK